jgi:hypothetical protein
MYWIKTHLGIKCFLAGEHTGLSGAKNSDFEG